MTWFRALEQSIVSLSVEQPMFIKACLLKLVVNIGSEYKIILVLDQVVDGFVSAVINIGVAVDVDVS